MIKISKRLIGLSHIKLIHSKSSLVHDVSIRYLAFSSESENTTPKHL